MYSKYSVALLAVAGAAAQQFGDISHSCQNVFTGIIADQNASACINPTGLLGFLAVANSSIVGPATNWLTGVCGSPPCDNETLSSIISNFTTGCSAELQAFGVTGSNINATAEEQLEKFYPTTRKVVCLKDNDTLCVVDSLNDLQDVWGTLSLNNIPEIVMRFFAGNGVPQNVTCSNCTKAAVTIINQDFPGTFSNDTQFDSCPSNFTDGTTPDGITQTANNSPPGTSNNNDNSEIRPVATAGAVLAAIFGAFVAFL